MYACLCVLIKSKLNMFMTWHAIFMHRVHWMLYVHWYTCACMEVIVRVCVFCTLFNSIHVHTALLTCACTDSTTFCIGYMTYMHVHMLDSLTST